MPWVENFRHLFKESAAAERILICGDMQLKGDLQCVGPGSIAAHIEGDIHSNHHLSLDDVARVDGACAAANLHVSGEITGQLTSREHTRLGPGSVVRGGICSDSLEITGAADFQGPLEIGNSPL